MDNICGIVLKVSYPNMGDTSVIEILGKTMMEWVCFSLGDNFCGSVAYSDSTPLPILVRPYVKKDTDYTVVLFSDTPLISRKTVLDAVSVLKLKDLNVLKMTRGYVFKTQFLLGVDRIYSENPYYFDEEDFMTAFNFKQVALVSDALRNRIISYHMNQGVQFDDIASTFVGCDVIIAKGVHIGPGNIIKGKTIIKEHARIGSHNTIDDSVIESGAFLTYVGDAEVGSSCNLGCGVVIANYDGKNKHKTVIGDNAFIGSNCNLIAPLNVGDGAFVAAGSTITDSVPENALAIARERQIVKPDWRNKNV